MSATFIPSFDTLPIELIYRILDNLDEKIIVLSLHHVCKRLDTIINTYFNQSRYKLNSDRISKPDFVRVCHLIQPENILSLTLSDKSTTAGQISLFLSFFSIKRFTRLHSLTLFKIEDQHLNLILKHAVTCPLISLSIHEKNNSDHSKTTDALLSTIMERSGLQNLTLSLMEDGADQIKWPTSSTIQHLTLYNCHLKHFPIIFRHFSTLRTLSIKNCDLYDYLSINYETPLDLIPMRQLTSLRMENLVINMSKMISILSNTPSLTHLRLTGSINKIDFRWEELIQAKLPLLTQFEFSFSIRISHGDNNSTVNNALIAAFRTPFWLEIKKWFVTCDQNKRLNNQNRNLNDDIQLYSLPIRDHNFQYYPDSYRMTSSTSMELNNDAAAMDDVRTVYLKAEMMVTTTAAQESENTSNHLNSMQITSSTLRFRKVLNLKIRFDNTWSCDFVQRLSSLIDLSHLEKLVLIDEFPQDLYPNTLVNFVNLLEKACNIHSLVITATWLDETCISNMENFCSMLPHHIKHLEIDVEFMDDMKIILDRLEHLSSVTFRYLNGNEHWRTNIIEWLTERRDSTYCTGFETLHIWLGKKKSKTSRHMTTDSKRFKTDYY